MDDEQTSRKSGNSWFGIDQPIREDELLVPVSGVYLYRLIFDELAEDVNKQDDNSKMLLIWLLKSTKLHSVIYLNN